MRLFDDLTADERGQFFDEMGVLLEDITRLLLSLEHDPKDHAVCDELMRGAHTLKGNARLVELAAVERQSSALEEAIGEVKRGDLDLSPALVDLLLGCQDAIRDFLARLREGVVPEDNPLTPLETFLAERSQRRQSELRNRFPGLDADILSQITDQQKSQVLEAAARLPLYQASVTVPRTAPARLKTVMSALAPLAAPVLSFSGASSAIDQGFQVKILLGSDAPMAALGAALGPDGPSLQPLTSGAAAGTSEGEQSAFLEEVRQILLYDADARIQELTNALLALEPAPQDAGRIHETFRIVHGLRGAGASFGFPEVSALSFEMENMLEAARRGDLALSAAVMDSLFQGVDALRAIFDAARQGGTAGPRTQAVIAHLQQTAARLPAAPHGGTGAVQVAQDLAAVPAQAAAPEESLRVGLSKLDVLATLSGEMTVIHRAWETTLKDLDALIDLMQDARREFSRVVADVQGDPAWASVSSHPSMHKLVDLSKQVSALVMDRGERITSELTLSSVRAGAALESLQREITRVRMVPVARVFERFPRMMRDMARTQRKDVTLAIFGEHTEVDKRVLDELADPLMHLLRNAVDHGIEDAADRIRLGKPPQGSLKINAYHQGNELVVEVADDGRGIDWRKIRERALEMGLVDRARGDRMQRDEWLNMIFVAGFTTRATVSEISGRGVGMDVVKNRLESLKGSIEVDTRVGRGTTYRLKVPLTLANMQAVLVKAAGQIFCMPLPEVAEVLFVPLEDIMEVRNQWTVERRGRLLPLLSLGEALGLADGVALTEEGRLVVVVVRSVEKVLGLVVDALLLQQQIVVRTLGPFLAGRRLVAGATVLGTGDVALVLNVPEVIRRCLDMGVPAIRDAPSARAYDPAGRRVLLVEDSAVSRDLLRALLEDVGYHVVAVENGSEALAALAAQPVDLVVTDLDMPVLDGLELIASLKAREETKHIPVVVVTGVAGAELMRVRQTPGADALIVKSAFNQRTFLETVAELLVK